MSILILVSSLGRRSNIHNDNRSLGKQVIIQNLAEYRPHMAEYLLSVAPNFSLVREYCHHPCFILQVILFRQE